MHRGVNYWVARATINDRIDPENPSREDLDELIELMLVAPENITRNSDKVPKTFFLSQYGADKLKLMTESFAREYKGDFVFMQEMCVAVSLNGVLSPKQAAATLNVLLSNHKRERMRMSKFPKTDPEDRPKGTRKFRERPSPS